MKQLSFLLFIFVVISFNYVQGARDPNSPLKGEAEAGAVLVGGGSESNTYAGKMRAAYRKGLDTYSLFGHYIRADANGIENTKSWDLGGRYSWQLTENMSYFLGQQVESDIYAGYLQRDNSDIGLQKDLITSDEQNLFIEGGYRYSKTQILDEGNSYNSFGRLYVEYSRSFDKTISLRYWFEYLPNFTDAEDYMANTELSMNIMLNSVLSLRMGYLLRYQNIPATELAKYSTRTTTMNLVARF